jgi:hypothetical protein
MNPSELIDNYIADKPGWRGNMIAKLRRLVLEATPDIAEEKLSQNEEAYVPQC